MKLKAKNILDVPEELQTFYSVETRGLSQRWHFFTEPQEALNYAHQRYETYCKEHPLADTSEHTHPELLLWLQAGLKVTVQVAKVTRLKQPNKLFKRG